ncbi:MAG: hypothetical protein E7594_07765 [Ruminococcaceae bacterium]|nr:hypothetical protein [Oscillospiraceae bacterium]
MKRIVSVLLTLLMLIGIIPISTLTVSAASQNDGWNVVFSYQEFDEDGAVDRIITIYKKDRNGSWGLKWSALKIETQVWQDWNYRYLTSTYETKEYLAFFKQYLTVEDICSKDDNLSDNGIFDNIEKIDGCSLSLIDPASRAANVLKEEFSGTAKKEINGKLKGDADDFFYERVKAHLGAASSLTDLVRLAQEAKETCNFFEKLIKNAMRGLRIMTVAMDNQLGKDISGYRSLLEENVNEFFEKFDKIGELQK